MQQLQCNWSHPAPTSRNHCHPVGANTFFPCSWLCYCVHYGGKISSNVCKTSHEKPHATGSLLSFLMQLQRAKWREYLEYILQGLLIDSMFVVFLLLHSILRFAWFKPFWLELWKYGNIIFLWMSLINQHLSLTNRQILTSEKPLLLLRWQKIKK